jgi:hypothetical protein
MRNFADPALQVLWNHIFLKKGEGVGGSLNGEFRVARREKTHETKDLRSWSGSSKIENRGVLELEVGTSHSQRTGR